MQNVYEFLSENKIKYILHKHPAVYTCEEADKYRENISGVACKNLFLQNKKGKRFFLVILPAEKQTDLKKFAHLVEEKKVSFSSKETLKKLLGLESGAVSPFGLLNDENKKVELYIDYDIYNADSVSFHPNINTETLELSQEMFHKFLKSLGRKEQVITI